MKQFYPDRFKDKVITLTDAARGIDEATVIRAAKEGAKLVPADRLKEEGERVLNAVRVKRGTAIFLNLDLSAEKHVEQVAGATVKTYRRLDIAINNTGVMGNPNPFHELEREQMDYTVVNNFYSVFLCCEYEIREFTKEGGRDIIVNSASIARLTSFLGNPAYVASKRAVNGLTKNLTPDYTRYEIRINSVNPAGTTTPMVAEVYGYVRNHREAAIKAGMDPVKAQSMVGQKLTSMLEQEATAEEQVASILFLVSDDVAHMTGVMVQIGGGWMSFWERLTYAIISLYLYI